MAKIPLRVYIKDIENLIERGEIEQAVAHAKSILRTYPKHLETYRLLGKAYLESQRYSEASDILQRVLSVMPDDFISQIGMSIIREDEGNMDAAIWHMERAYEVQPFNPAVQDELRRLYGRRDGVEPPKIRLTRGALVRMYARGELYPQAIAETRAALAEDPQRLDLRVLLARLYYLSGQKNDAAEVCSELISKLPFCYEANRLLTEILPTTSRASETPKFQQRIYALDPYEAFISPTAPTSQQVPDQAVMVEEFALEQGAEALQTPDWARSVGVEWEDQPEENLPDWLNTLKPEAPAAEVQAAAPEPIEQVGEDLVPDWMKEAGWEQTDRPSDEIVAEQQALAEAGIEGMEESGEEVIQAAEIPDWLQSMAPAETAPSGEGEQERSEWLENILSEPISSGELKELETELSGVEPREEEIVPTSEEETPLPDWIAGFGSVIEPAPGTPESAAQEPAPAEGEETLPDWLAQLQGQEESPTAPVSEEGLASTGDIDLWDQESESIEPSAEQPVDWLQALETETGSEAPALEWEELQNAPSQSSEVSAVDEIAPALEEEEEQEIPDWLAEVPFAAEEKYSPAPAAEIPAVAEPPAEQAAEMPDMADTDAMMAWLESLAARQGADEATLITRPEERTETPPDWVMKEIEEAGSEEITQPVSTINVQPEEISLAEEALPEDAGEVAKEGFFEDHLSQVPAGEELAAPDLTSEDAALAWLESLAAAQGADETSLITSPEEQSVTPPEWQAVEEQEAEEAAPSTLDESVRLIPETEETILSTEIEEMPESEPLPSWLAEETVETAGETPSVTAETTKGAPELSDIDAAMAWLESLAARQGADEQTLTTAPEERTENPPDWVMKEIETAETLSEVEFEAPVVEAGIPEQVEGMPVAEEEQPSLETETHVEEIPTPAVETEPLRKDEELPPPEWLKNLEEEEIAEHFSEAQEMPWSAEAEPAAASAEPLPDWMLAAEPEKSLSAAPESEAIPDWLLGLEEEGEYENISPQETPPVETGDYRAAWTVTGTEWVPEVSAEEVEVTAPEISQPVLEVSPAEEPVLPSAGEEQLEAVPSGDLMDSARASLKHGQLEEALAGYNQLIEKEENLQEIIHDLRDALYRYPVDIDLWQTLGDACMHNNQLQEALDAYTKAEELLR